MAFLSFEFERFTGRVIREAIWVLVVLLALLLWYPHNLLLAGLAFGLAISVLNGFFLSLRMRKMLYLLPFGLDRARLFVQMGMAGRWGLVFAGLYFVVKTGWCSLPAVLAGLLVVPMFSVAEAIRVLICDRVQVGT